MSLKKEINLLVVLLIIGGVAAVLLFFGDPALMGDEATTEYVLKLILYPIVLAVIVLLWRQIDRKLKNDKPDFPGQ